jgi:hypothetical protein
MFLESFKLPGEAQKIDRIINCELSGWPFLLPRGSYALVRKLSCRRRGLYQRQACLEPPSDTTSQCLTSHADICYRVVVLLVQVTYRLTPPACCCLLLVPRLWACVLQGCPRPVCQRGCCLHPGLQRDHAQHRQAQQPGLRGLPALPAPILAACMQCWSVLAVTKCCCTLCLSVPDRCSNELSHRTEQAAVQCPAHALDNTE